MRGESFSTQQNKKTRLILLVICVLLIIGAGAIGVNDNPPGILLAFLAGVTFVLAFVHHWRSPRKFIFLFLASILGFILFIILGITFDSISQNPATSPALMNMIQSPANDALWLVVIMLSSAAFFIDAIGSIVMFIRTRQ